MEWYELKFEFISNVNSGNIGDNIILQRREQGKDVKHFGSLQLLHSFFLLSHYIYILTSIAREKPFLIQI